MAIGSIRAIGQRAVARGVLVVSLLSLPADGARCVEPPIGRSPARYPEENSSVSARDEAIAAFPFARLTPDARERILAIVQSPTIYRRLPTQAIDCDRDMFLFLSRNPEVLVGMWDLMGVTKVSTRRTGPFQLEAEDGSGTSCSVDLVYGDPHLHIFVADGGYDGRLVARPIKGKGVFLLRSSYAQSASGSTTVAGTIDCFVQFDSLGADLVARTLSGMIGRAADNNFVETARFMSQVSQASQRNPTAMIDVAERIPQVSHATRKQFIDTITAVAGRSAAEERTAKANPPQDRTR